MDNKILKDIQFSYGVFNIFHIKYILQNIDQEEHIEVKYIIQLLPLYLIVSKLKIKSIIYSWYGFILFDII